MMSEMDADNNQDSGLAHLAKDTAQQAAEGKLDDDGKTDQPVTATADLLARDLAETGAILPPEGITKAPKIDERAVSEEEREAKRLAEEEAKRTAELQNKKARTPFGRWWRKLQTSQDKITWGMMIVALGVVYGDIGTSPLYLSQSFVAGQGGIQ
nr:potassium transporter Kup [Alloscardovia omnicolens]